MNQSRTSHPAWCLRDADVPLSGVELGGCLAAAVEVLPSVERKKAWRRRRLNFRVASRGLFMAVSDVTDPSCSVATPDTELNNVRIPPRLAQDGAEVQVGHRDHHRAVERCRQPDWGTVPEWCLRVTS